MTTFEQTGWDYGVESEGGDGRLSTSWGWGEAAAVSFVHNHSSRSWMPRPVRAVRRPTGHPEAIEELNEETTDV